MNGTQINLESVRPKVSGPMWGVFVPGTTAYSGSLPASTHGENEPGGLPIFQQRN